MRKPIEDKTPLAAWATLSRDEAQMSVEEVVDALAARGHAVNPATIRGIEGGSKGASAKLRRLLAEVYGTTVPGQKETGPATGEAGALIAVLTRVAEAMEAQTQAIENQRGDFQGYADGLEALLVRLVSEHADTAAEPARLPAGRR